MKQVRDWVNSHEIFGIFLRPNKKHDLVNKVSHMIIRIHICIWKHLIRVASQQKRINPVSLSRYIMQGYSVFWEKGHKTSRLNQVETAESV